MGSKRAFGSILDRSWKGLGGIWEDLGRLEEILGKFGEAFARIWDFKLRNPPKRKRMERFRIKFDVSSMQGGGRCLREAALNARGSSTHQRVR